MNRLKGYAKMLFPVLLLAAFAAGCSSNDDNGGVSPDTTAPTVSYTIPLDLATDVTRNSSVNATFSEVMSAATINTATFTLTQGSTPVSGAVTYVGKTATFKPAGNLASDTMYTATITTGAKNQADTALAANYVWSFTTGTTLDTTAPTVSSTVPLNAATDVALNNAVNVIFSEAVSAATINTATFTLTQGSTPVSGAVTYLGRTATFTPASLLAAGTTYTATITTGVTDLADNHLAADEVWSFTTGASLSAGPAPVILGSAGNYVILAKTKVSTVPASAITGDVGLSPAATSYLTGFSLTMVGTTSATSPQVTGSLYAADMTVPTSSNLTTAVLDMMTAYTDAAGRAPDYTELGAGNIGGMTLYPGTYKWSTGVLIPSDVTLSGGPNDVWIFEIAGDITQASATSVNLAGGAEARNIFWQVAGGTGVAIGTNAHFEGIILAVKAITLNTGASVNGRLLAQTAVTLNANAVTQP